jgi:hypothetical protein
MDKEIPKCNFVILPFLPLTYNAWAFEAEQEPLVIFLVISLYTT